MKKLSLLLLTLTVCFFTACHKDIWAELENLDQRVTKLEELCKEMNTNITSLQTIVDVLQSNDFITSIVEIKKDGKVVGYTITFGKHDPITIYHGQNGKDGQNGQDGQNGADGKDGSTPVIGVAQDTDGVYYWTLNGEWLLDDNGNKLPVSGKDGQNGTNGKDGQDGADGKDGQDGEDGKDGADGQDGKDGADGKDGTDGQDGKDGITPQLKIEDGYWFISYDNGATWTQLGKATGEDGKDGTDGADGKDGQNGTNGKDGQDGDSMFQSVTQDENYVYFTLADGTVIKIAKGTSTEEEQPNSEFMFIVTYDANGGEGTMQPDTFYYGVAKKITPRKFTRASYCFVNWNTKVDGSGISYSNEQELMISKNITLYANWKAVDCKNYEYVDLGLSVLWSTCNIGASKPEGYGSYFAWGETYTKSNYTTPTYAYYINGVGFTKYCTNSSYGSIDNKTILDATDDVARVKWGGNWRIPTSAEISELRAKCSWTWTTNGYKVTSKINGNSIFLPAAGYKSGTSSTNVGYGYYWANSLYTLGSDYDAIVLWFYSSNVESSGLERWYGGSVRPVCR
jgi:hypothetical protein